MHITESSIFEVKLQAEYSISCGTYCFCSLQQMLQATEVVEDNLKLRLA